MVKGQINNVMANRAYFERQLKRRSIAGETNRPMAYDSINEKVRDKNFNLLVDPHGTLNIDRIDNNQFRIVKGPEGIHINEKVQSKHNQSHSEITVDTENPDLHPISKHSSTVSDIAQGMRLALGIAEPIRIPIDRKATRQLSRVAGINRPVANKTWSKQEIERLGVYTV
jgi:hypothetical protein